jgi:hypothetical protein
MPNRFSKSRSLEKPYAVYRDPEGNWEWRILKTYKTPASEEKDWFARWMVAAKSPHTWGSFEYGDTYAREVRDYGVCVAADPEWREAYGIHAPLPTPAELK